MLNNDQTLEDRFHSTRTFLRQSLLSSSSVDEVAGYFERTGVEPTKFLYWLMQNPTQDLVGTTGVLNYLISNKVSFRIDTDELSSRLFEDESHRYSNRLVMGLVPSLLASGIPYARCRSYVESNFSGPSLQKFAERISALPRELHTEVLNLFIAKNQPRYLDEVLHCLTGLEAEGLNQGITFLLENDRLSFIGRLKTFQVSRATECKIVQTAASSKTGGLLIIENVGKFAMLSPAEVIDTLLVCGGASREALADAVAARLVGFSGLSNRVRDLLLVVAPEKIGMLNDDQRQAVFAMPPAENEVFSALLASSQGHLALPNFQGFRAVELRGISDMEIVTRLCSSIPEDLNSALFYLAAVTSFFVAKEQELCEEGYELFLSEVWGLLSRQSVVTSSTQGNNLAQKITDIIEGLNGTIRYIHAYLQN